jgi:carboxyl-terminal processing protease
MRGLILDLRWCPGGKMIEAVNIAEMFVGNARALTVVATVKNRDGRINEYSTSHERKFDVPLVVLLNGETSGGAELIAAALQDHGRARVVGQRTRGKGSVQSPLPVPAANLYFKLTTGTFQRPSGKNMHRFPDSKPTDDWGVRPDRGLESRVSPDLAKRLKEWWLLQTLRPGSSTEILPLDDPTSDPQRQDALAALEKVLRTEG